MDQSSKISNYTLQQKAKFVIDEGIYLSKSSYKYLEINLYKVDGEFVEVWYSTKLSRIIKVDFLVKKDINPYLKHIAVLYSN